jgi:hypothetical protein
MRKLVAVGVIGWICAVVAPVGAQQVDVAFGGGSLYSSSSILNAGTFLPGEGGGAFHWIQR